MRRTSTGTVRVAIVEDGLLSPDALDRALASEPGVRVVVTASTASEAARLLAPGVADVVVLDVDRTDGDGVALGVALCRAQPRLGLVLLAGHDGTHGHPDLPPDVPPDIAARWVHVARSPSTGPAPLGHAVRTAHAAARGQRRSDAGLTGIAGLAGPVTPRAPSAIARLTERQLAVLRLLGQGLSNAGIGTELGITEKSVQNHVNAVYATLGIDPDPAHNARVVAALRLLQETGRV